MSVNNQRWHSVVNVSGEAIPPFAVMKQTLIGGGRGLSFHVEKPGTSNPSVMFNGASQIPIGGMGSGTFDGPAWTLFDLSVTAPQNGDNWGAADASWKLSLDTAGFKILGVSSPRVIVMATDGMCQRYLGQTVGAMATGDATKEVDGLIALGRGKATTESSLTGTNLLAGETDDNGYVLLERDEVNDRWIMVTGQCPA